METGSKVKLVASPMLCLYHNGNYVKAFKTIDELDAYLREEYRWCDADVGRVLKSEVNMDGSWSVVRSEFLKYEDA